MAPMMAIETIGPHPRPALVNVGLPRSGTQSFTAAAERLGLRAAHIGYGENDWDGISRFRECGTGPVGAFMLQYDVLSDSPYYGLVEALAANCPATPLVSTTRSQESWIASCSRHPAAGGRYMRTVFGIGDLRQIYDRHAALLRKFAVPTIPLEAPDEVKWRVLCAALKMKLPRNRAWPRIDCIGTPAFRVDGRTGMTTGTASCASDTKR
jgi:hypothetical protein